ncbi:hypothetical protein PGT21_033194 [Puccinia graminis f. sp. tritici]|uniref:Ribose-phosphate pyrophosphokinase N-terminal domain-containing protein n=1 Tax=Puccinia graminis f. sp. tritici TaxID=56615 RepID=A0A5B0NRX0_PUCGR|nr:hypothetical protein PGTUg99_034671 [Puccinia graminis f. sp. tritici]KAA1091412.1 hypothetical protein PGT21_033194 [Puccinia graminis f. sp. tritici]
MPDYCSGRAVVSSELLIMIHSCSIASAGRITAVIPHFPYARIYESLPTKNQAISVLGWRASPHAPGSVFR